MKKILILALASIMLTIVSIFTHGWVGLLFTVPGAVCCGYMLYLFGRLQRKS